MKRFSAPAWFGRNQMGGFKPVSWQGWLLTLLVFGFDFAAVYSVFTPGGIGATGVWMMLLVNFAFFSIAGATGSAVGLWRRK